MKMNTIDATFSVLIDRAKKDGLIECAECLSVARLALDLRDMETCLQALIGAMLRSESMDGMFNDIFILVAWEVFERAGGINGLRFLAARLDERKIQATYDAAFEQWMADEIPKRMAQIGTDISEKSKTNSHPAYLRLALRVEWAVTSPYSEWIGHNQHLSDERGSL